MPAANSMTIKRETLNLRRNGIRPAERDLIDRAAKARGKTVLILWCWKLPVLPQRKLLNSASLAADPDAYQALLVRLIRPLRQTPRCVKTAANSRAGNRKCISPPKPLHAGHILISFSFCGDSMDNWAVESGDENQITGASRTLFAVTAILGW